MADINWSFEGGVGREGVSSSRKRERFWWGTLTRALADDSEWRGEPPVLCARKVLTWGCAFLGRTGDWPEYNSGEIPEAPGETWLLISAALARGLRGLPRTGSLERFFAEREGRFNPADLNLSDERILELADVWKARTGDWPTRDSGIIVSCGRLNWRLIDDSIRAGRKHVPGEGSLADFLARRRGAVRSPLSVRVILAWADAFYKRAGHWPSEVCGPVAEMRSESWNEINIALVEGLRGLPGGSSVAGLLAAKRGTNGDDERRAFSIAEIVRWADGYHAETGNWPDSESGQIPESPGDEWSDVQHALVWGGRGLDGDSSIGKVLSEERDVTRNIHWPEVTIPHILSWADTYHARNGHWPNRFSGPVGLVPGESWRSIELAVRFACRGLPRGWSLTRLFIQKRTKKDHTLRPQLSTAQILRWADAHHEETGEWPGSRSGVVRAAPEENWANIQQALRLGFRGLPGGQTLRGLLSEERGATGGKVARRLSVERILAWADAHHRRTGEWPRCRPDPIPESPGDNWQKVNTALYTGSRKMRGGSSLALLLAERRGVPHRYRRKKLTYAQVLEWADAFHARTGEWPTSRCGAVPDAPGETWAGIHSALDMGYRGFPGGSSLALLLADERGQHCAAHRTPLSLPQVLRWADAHFERTGAWPSRDSGVIPESSGETWSAVQSAMEAGARGMIPGLSLAKLRRINPTLRSALGLPVVDSKAHRQTPAQRLDGSGRQQAQEPAGGPLEREHNAASKSQLSSRVSRRTTPLLKDLSCQHTMTSPA